MSDIIMGYSLAWIATTLFAWASGESFLGAVMWGMVWPMFWLMTFLNGIGRIF